MEKPSKESLEESKRLFWQINEWLVKSRTDALSWDGRKVIELMAHALDRAKSSHISYKTKLTKIKNIDENISILEGLVGE